MCLLQSRSNVAENNVLINSIIGNEVHIGSRNAIVHSHLTSPMHITSGCLISGLDDSDISVSNLLDIF